ncbi:MAG: hypothetical protein KDA87_00435 [Planctomycetales bacterium]|nr:hypothetical protein [Planctomycetales bacterium]
MRSVYRYIADLNHAVGSNWNRFWFQPDDVVGVCLLRLVLGLITVWWLLSFGFDLALWFGPNSIANSENIQPLLTHIGSPPEYHFSIWNFEHSNTSMWAVHVASVIVVIAYAAGLLTPLTSWLTLLVTLSYIQHNPFMNGRFEATLVWALAYLAIAPSGRCLSLDHIISPRKQDRPHPFAPPAVRATICQRLLQVHLVAIYLYSACSKLLGETWWSGQAVWWQLTQVNSALVDLRWLAEPKYHALVNAWTLGIVLFEFAFAVLVWPKITRPLFLFLSLVHWSFILLITGDVGFCVLMIVLNLAFVGPSEIRNWYRGHQTDGSTELG